MHTRPFALVAGLTLLVGTLAAGPAGATTITLGQQDFVDGAILSLGTFNTASVGEAAPFNGFNGTDLGSGPAFSATWNFNFAAQAVTSASLSFGIFDHDSQAPGSQIASFSIDGVDFTGQLNALFEGAGGAQTQYNVYSLVLPGSLFVSLSDGFVPVSLTLQAPPLPLGVGNGNGAGLDFSTLNLNMASVPEPGTLGLFAAAFAALGFVRRRRAS